MIWKVENKVTHKIETWYSGSLIDLIKKECLEAIETYDKEDFYEDDCDKFLGESFMAQRIMDLIEERANE